MSRKHIFASVPDLIRNLIAFFDETDLFVLMILVGVAYWVRLTYFDNHSWKAAAKYVTGPIAFMYGLHLATITGSPRDLVASLAIVARTAMIAWIVQNAVCFPVLFLAQFLTRLWQTERERRRLSQELAERNQREKKECVIEPPPIVPIARDISLRHEAQQAKADFDFECEVIQSVGLDDDEKDAAITESRQKFLRRLQAAMQ